MCKWIHTDKKKKKSQKELSKWMPCRDNDTNECLLTYDFSCIEPDNKPTHHHMVMRFIKNIKPKSSYLLFKIKSNYYVKNSSDPNSLVMIKM